MLEVIKDKIRVYMNDIADHMAGGGCQDHEEYIRLVGKVEALALIAVSYTHLRAHETN